MEQEDYYNRSKAQNDRANMGLQGMGMGIPIPMMIPAPPMAVPMPPVMMPPVMMPPVMMPPVMMPPAMMPVPPMMVPAPPMIMPMMMPIQQQGQTKSPPISGQGHQQLGQRNNPDAEMFNIPGSSPSG